MQWKVTSSTTCRCPLAAARPKEIFCCLISSSSVKSALGKTLSTILDGLELPDGGEVLEIGPGSGKFALEFSVRGYAYVGFDMVPDNVELHRTVAKCYSIRPCIFLQDICDVPEPAPRFDGIFSVSTFEHIHDRDAALRNCYRLLRPGGSLVILDGNALDPRIWFEMVIKRAIKTRFKSRGLKWILSREKVVNDFGLGWKGKDEAVRSVFWWRRHIPKFGFDLVDAFTSTRDHRILGATPLHPFAGRVCVVARRPR